MSKISKNDKEKLDKIIIQSDEVKKKVRVRVKKSTKPKKEPRAVKRAVRDAVYEYETSMNEKMTVEKHKNSPSDFRKKSAKWRDVPKANVADIGRDIEEKSFGDVYDEKSFAQRIKAVRPIQWACAGMAVVIFVSALLTTSAYADYKSFQHKEVAFAQLPTYNETADTHISSIREEIVTETETEAAVIEEPETKSVLSLVLTSVEKDLKIKLVDDSDTLVKGVSWGVTVADSKGKETSFNDDEQDGIIHITDINAGDYSVTINPSDNLEGYTIPSTASMVSVKAKVEYKVIANIKDEIKSEKEVNAAAEDANGNKAADVETGTALKDTVEFVESTKTENGEKYVEAKVDLSKCELAKVSIFDRIANIYHTLTASESPVISKNVASTSVIRLVATQDTDSGESSEGQSETSSENPPADNTHECTFGDFTPDGQGNHYRKCTVEGCDKTESAACSGDYSKDANTHSKICSVCGYTITSQEAHSFEGNKCKVCGYEKAAEPTVKAVTGVALSETAKSMVVGESKAITATVAPADASNKDLTWKSSNEAVASVSNGTITAKSAGTATITVTTVDQGKTATCAVTVTASSGKKYKATSPLYDSAGNKLYKKDGDSYTLATYADYEANPSRTFYRQEKGFLYTGWQTINNQTYYYKADHTYVTGDQVIGGVVYHFATDGALTKGSGTLGIDVSKYQPSINWSSVAASGISYVIIRCGYRGASTGALIQDPYFTSHVKGAKAAGLKVGVYFFSTALNEAEAVEEASMCAALCSGYGINYPVFIDVESSTRPGYNGLSAAQRTANIKAFCSTVRSAGYTAGVYANKTWFTSYINTSELSGYKIWLAQYNAAGPTYSGRYDLWQYTSKGSVNGISGNVDMNQSYLGY